MSAPATVPRVVRLRGFPDRLGLAEALAWAASWPALGRAETLPLAQAAGRVAAGPVATPADWPARDQAAADGYAARAADTLGASSYAPLPLMGARLVAAGEAMPPGADAVLGFDTAQPGMGPATIEALAAAAPGEGVLRRAEGLRAGTECVPTGRQLGPVEIGLLTGLGIQEVLVHARPRAALLVPGTKDGAADALTPMLAGLVRQDGGLPAFVPIPTSRPRPPPAGDRETEAGGAEAGRTDDPQDALAAAARAAVTDADLLLVAGRSGAGPDDVAVPALRASGAEFRAHGIALRPGGSSALGILRGVPVLVLSGEALACLTAYTLLARPLLRRLAGLPDPAPATATFRLRRKIVSAIGFTDVIRVTLRDGEAVPSATAEATGLALASAADGVVIVPERLEGYAAGEMVSVRSAS